MVVMVTGEKSKKTTEKGITLIALVVTIIVLLILAGVSIQMLTGQNGILKRAQEASDKTKRANIIEEVQMEIFDKETEQEGEISHKDLHDILDEYFENVPELGEDGTWEDFPNNFEEPLVSREDKKIEVEIGEIYKGSLTIKTGEENETEENIVPPPPVAEEITSEEVASDLSTYIGAYVNYGVDLDGNTGTPDWRILYAQNNRIYLIAADCVPTDNAALVDAMGEGESNAMMKPSTESGYEALCANWASSLPNDLQTITLGNWANIFKDGSYELNEEYINSRCVARLRETTNWAEFAEGTGGEYAIGGPTAQMWCAAWNTIIPAGGKTEGSDIYKQITADVTSAYGYKYTSESTTSNYFYVNGTTSYLTDISTLEKGDTYSLFFPHTEYQNITANGKTANCYGYWLASPSAYGSGNLMFVNCGGCVNYGIYNFSSLGVRPVVSLTSGIRLTDSGKIQKGKPVYDIVQ